MEKYSVVRYDDGIYACILDRHIKRLNGKYSAKWKNTYFNVELVKSGTKQACESFITYKKSSVSEGFEHSKAEDPNNGYNFLNIYDEVNNKQLQSLHRDSENNECDSNGINVQSQDSFRENVLDNVGEPFGSDFSDCDPTFIPDSEISSDEEANSCEDHDRNKDKYVSIKIKEKIIGKQTALVEVIETNVNASHTPSSDGNTLEALEDPPSDDQKNCVDGRFSESVPEIRRGTNKFHCNLEFSTKKKKKNFCIFCKKLFTQLPRHLEKAHLEEAEVKHIMSLPKNSYERKGLLDKIRKKGNFQHNGDRVFNTGILITARRNHKGDITQYIPCSKCLGFFSKKSLRKHFKKCGKITTGARSIISNGRRVEGDISCKANEIVKNFIFPVLRDDHITRPLRYDDLVITYANKMTLKYPKSHHYPMIRSRLRLIGKILYEVKKIDPTVSDFSSILLPQKYDAIVTAIKIIAQLDSENSYYKSPSTASSAGTLLKKCANIYVTELIKQENNELKLRVLDFLKILDVDLAITVNKQVLETQLKQKRNKKNILPSKQDIRSLNDYLQKCRRHHFDSLKKHFNADNYVELQKATLTSIQLFNRKRAGEVQRIEVEDFSNYECYDNNRDQEIVDDFPEEWKKDAVNFVRFTIRGKLGREVPVLLYKELLEILKYLVQNREKAGILEKNPYIFAIPQSKDKCLDACLLMRHFSTLCNAKNPETLRGTILRKDLATKSMVHGDIPVTDMADFMGHDPKIHLNHYRLPRATRDLARVSRMLMLGSGMEVGANENIDSANVGLNNYDTITDENVVNSHNSSSLNLNSGPESDRHVEKNESLNRSAAKRSTSPMGHITRRSWTANEKTTVFRVFSHAFSTGKLPSLNQCQEAILFNKELESRSPVQLKTWVHNQLKKKPNIPVEENVKCKIKRTPWSSSEKSAAHKELRKYIDGGILPSITVCREIIERCPALHNRTPIQLKLFVSNNIKKITK